MTGPLARIAREPVLTGAAVLATLEAAVPDLSPGWKLAATAWVALFQRAFSTPKAAAEEAVANATAGVEDQVEVAKYVGAVENQATAIAGRVIARTRPPADGMPPA